MANFKNEKPTKNIEDKRPLYTLPPGKSSLSTEVAKVKASDNLPNYSLSGGNSTMVKNYPVGYKQDAEVVSSAIMDDMMKKIKQAKGK